MDEVQVTDVEEPTAPKDNLIFLIDYFQGAFPKSKQKLREMLVKAQSLKHKEDVISLGYEVLLFRMELDEWVGFAGQLLDENRAEQLIVAHDEQAQEAKERGSARPSSEVVKAQAGQYLAPLKRAHQEIKDTQNWMASILSWCQSQQKMMANEEYGDLFQANNIAPNIDVPKPPSVADALRSEK